MATIVNNPPASNNSGGPMVMIIVIAVLIVLGYIGFVYVLPSIGQMGGTQINVPDKIDVNINQTK